VISTDDARDRALNSGALAFVAKPIQTKDVVDRLVERLRDYLGRRQKSLLVVEPDPAQSERIWACVGGSDLQVTTVADGHTALQMLRERRVDCMILPPALTDLSPADFAAAAQCDPMVEPVPVLVYGDAQQEEGTWKPLAENFSVRVVQSPERLMDQAAFYLHR